MQPLPVYKSYESVVEQIGYKPRVVYLTPQGKVFNQSMAEEDVYKRQVKYIGVGEQIDDLQRFDSKEFVEALFTE